MTPADVITQFRSQVDDEAQPNLWTDDEVMLYLIDAQDMYVRLTGGIADVTVAAADVGSPATRLADLALTAGQPYTLHSPYILRIRSARLLTAARDVIVASEGDLQQVMVKDYGWVRGLTFDDADTGNVDYGVLGIRENYVRWVKVPASVDTCRLHVQRLPYPRIVDEEDAFEIGEEHHLHLIKWMKHMAYSKEDAETYDKDLAAANEASFRRYCEQGKKERERRQYKPRTVVYGGL